MNNTYYFFIFANFIFYNHNISRTKIKNKSVETFISF